MAVISSFLTYPNNHSNESIFIPCIIVVVSLFTRERPSASASGREALFWPFAVECFISVSRSTAAAAGIVSSHSFISVCVLFSLPFVCFREALKNFSFCDSHTLSRPDAHFHFPALQMMEFRSYSLTLLLSVVAMSQAMAMGVGHMRPINLHPAWWSHYTTPGGAPSLADKPLPVGLFVEPVVEIPWSAVKCGMSCTVSELFLYLNSTAAYEARQYTDFIANIKRYDYLSNQGNQSTVIQYFLRHTQTVVKNDLSGNNSQSCEIGVLPRPPLTPLDIPAVGTDYLPLYGWCEHRHGNASGFPFDLWLSPEWNGPVVFSITGFLVDFYFGSPPVDTSGTYDHRLFSHPSVCENPNPQPPTPPSPLPCTDSDRIAKSTAIGIAIGWTLSVIAAVVLGYVIRGRIAAADPLYSPASAYNRMSTNQHSSN